MPKKLDWKPLLPALIEFRSAGMSWDKITEKLGVSISALEDFRDKHGHLIPEELQQKLRPTREDQQIKQTLELRAKGWTYKQISKELKISRSTVSGIISRNKDKLVQRPERLDTILFLAKNSSSPTMSIPREFIIKLGAYVKGLESRSKKNVSADSGSQSDKLNDLSAD